MLSQIIQDLSRENQSIIDEVIISIYGRTAELLNIKTIFEKKEE